MNLDPISFLKSKAEKTILKLQRKIEKRREKIDTKLKIEEEGRVEGLLVVIAFKKLTFKDYSLKCLKENKIH